MCIRDRGALGLNNWFEVGVSGNIGLDYTFNDIPVSYTHLDVYKRQI